MILKRIGSVPSGKRLERIKNSENYKNGEFWNIEPTSVNPNNVSFFTILKEFISRPKSVTPSEELPHIKTDLAKVKDEKPTVVWFGHSSYFLSYKGFRILIDPVFSGNALQLNSSEDLFREQMFIPLKISPKSIFFCSLTITTTILITHLLNR